jgi:hypothetical protein
MILVVLIMLGSQLLSSQSDYRNPSYFSSYSDNGYYKIDPETILAALDNGETNIFFPMQIDPNESKDLNNSISWTQAEYLKIANALSQLVWNETLDLEAWKVYFVYYQVGCDDNLSGFNGFSIVYYKNLGINEWKKIYTTRFIEIYPWMGVVLWGSDNKFTSSIWSGWDHMELTKYLISSDVALQIAEKNGGKILRVENENECRISVSMIKRFNYIWKVDYSSISTALEIYIDPYTGKFEGSKTK